MWSARWRKTKKAAGNPRRRLLLWAAVVGVIFSAIDAGEPLENFLHTVRNRLHSTPTSGKIAVIGIDDRSVVALGRWPWPRRDLAQIIDNLNKIRSSQNIKLFFIISMFYRLRQDLNDKNIRELYVSKHIFFYTYKQR